MYSSSLSRGYIRRLASMSVKILLCLVKNQIEKNQKKLKLRN